MAIAESPADEEMETGRNLIGRAGRVWNEILAKAAVPRSMIRVVNAVPCQPAKNKFENHLPADRMWGMELMEREVERAIKNGVELIVPMGNNPLKWLVPSLPEPHSWTDDESKQVGQAEKSKIGVWRGSLFLLADPPVDVDSYFASLEEQEGVHVLPTYHPSYIARNMEDNPWSVKDWGKVGSFLSGGWEYPKKRKWYVNRYDLLPGVYGTAVREGAIGIDTESSPKIVALVTKDEVHCFVWTEECEVPMRRILESERILKIAQNAGHDWTFFHLMGFHVALPHYDTGGGHHLATGGVLRKNLSPAISTYWTTYPHHKWMAGFDMLRYCGVDSAVGYDACMEQQPVLRRKQLWGVVEHDHQLLMDLLEVQWHGVVIDEVARSTAEQLVEVETEWRRKRFRELVEPVVRKALEKYIVTGDKRDTVMEKPHLYFCMKQCKCCGGGVKARMACWRCCGKKIGMELPDKAPGKALLVEWLATSKWVGAFGPRAHPDDVLRRFESFEKMKKVELEELMFKKCEACDGLGAIGQWTLDKLASSDDQLKDVYYRALRLPKRYFKRKITVRAAQVETLLDRTDLTVQQRAVVEGHIAYSKAESDLDSLRQLTPGVDGLIHSVFDPWGTNSGRVASKEGLLQTGTNMQNKQLKLRHVVVPRRGKLYVAPDYSQIETRNVAVVADDEGMRQAFVVPINRQGHPRHGTIDSHTIIQLAVLDKLGVEITRDQCKILGYGGMYGGGGPQIAKELTTKAFAKGEGKAITDAEGTAMVELLLQVIWPGLRKWHSETALELVRSGLLCSPTGRQFKWNGYIKEKDGTLKRKVLNEGLSRYPQDMGAWILAMGLRRVKKYMRKLVTPCIHVHDELVLEIPEGPGGLVDEALAGITECMTVTQWGMEYPIEEPVPAVNWLAAKDPEKWRAMVEGR